MATTLCFNTIGTGLTIHTVAPNTLLTVKGKVYPPPPAPKLTVNDVNQFIPVSFSFPMEMHLVHIASKLNRENRSATDPENIPEGLAVLGFLFEVGYHCWLTGILYLKVWTFIPLYVAH